MNDRWKKRLRFVVAVASVIVPLAVVVISLPYHGGLWLLLALAGGAAASVVLFELSERSDSEPPAAEVSYLPGSLRLLEIQLGDASGDKTQR